MSNTSYPFIIWVRRAIVPLKYESGHESEFIIREREREIDR